METLIKNLVIIPTACILKIIKDEKSEREVLTWEVINEIKPIDLYCYLYARFGKPNGLQNLFRSNDSDNLIHWEWTLGNESFVMMIQGMNFRTEVHIFGTNLNSISKEDFITCLKTDFSKHGKRMSELRSSLEKWTEFINPYYRVQTALENSIYKIKELDIDPLKDKLDQPTNADLYKDFNQKWNALNDKYYFSIGLSFGIRTMLPILAESFINLLLFVLAKPEIKSNKRLFDSIFKQHIDIRVQSLHLNCIGFTNPVDYSSEPCGKFHSIINERNDLLHGNVDINKLSFNELYFSDNIPLFIEYGDFWDKSIGVSLKSVNFNELFQDYETVKKFIEFILNHLDKGVKEDIEMIINKQDLGYNKKEDRIGILFPNHLVDFRAS